MAKVKFKGDIGKDNVSGRTDKLQLNGDAGYYYSKPKHCGCGVT